MHSGHVAHNRLGAGAQETPAAQAAAGDTVSLGVRSAGIVGVLSHMERVT